MPYPKSSKGIATIEFFYTPTNFRTFKYIEEIEKVLELLNNHVQFEPFVVLYSNPRNPTSKNCRDKGKYCAPDPDNDGKFTGRDVNLYKINLKRLSTKCSDKNVCIN